MIRAIAFVIGLLAIAAFLHIPLSRSPYGMFNSGDFWRIAMLAPLLILFGLLHVADGIVTYFGLTFFGLEEANPVLTTTAGLCGLGLSITLFKLAELGFLAFLFNRRDRMRNRWVKATLVSAVCFYGLVVTNNFALVFAS